MIRLLLIILFLFIPKDCWATRQVLLNGPAPLDTASVLYYQLNASVLGSSTESDRAFIAPFDGRLCDFSAATTVAPQNGAGVQMYTFTARIDGANTALTFNIRENNITNSNLDCVSFTAGQEINLSVTPSGTPAAASYYSGIYIISNTENETFLGISSTATALSNSANRFMNVGNQHPAAGTAAIETTKQMVVPNSATFKNLYVELTASPDLSFEFDMRKSTGGAFSDQAVDCTAMSTTCNSGADTFTAVQENLLTLKSDPSFLEGETPKLKAGVVMVPDIPGEYYITQFNQGSLDTSTTEYAGISSDLDWDSTESNVRQYTTRLLVKGMCVVLTAAPDNGADTQSYTFTLRHNGANTLATVTISESDQIECINDLSIILPASLFGSYVVVPSGTPTTAGAQITLLLKDLPTTFQASTIQGATLQ